MVTQAETAIESPLLEIRWTRAVGDEGIVLLWVWRGKTSDRCDDSSFVKAMEIVLEEATR